MSLFGPRYEGLRAHVEDLERRLSLTERRLDIALKLAERSLDELHNHVIKRGPGGKPKARTVTLSPEWLEEVAQLERRFRESDYRTAEVLAGVDVARRRLRDLAARR